MIKQKEITLDPMSKGFHNIDNIIMRTFDNLPDIGMVNIFVKHTSAALMINENADPDVQVDMKNTSKTKLHPKAIHIMFIQWKVSMICRLISSQLYLVNL